MVLNGERDAAKTFFRRVVWYRYCLIMHLPLYSGDLRALVVEVGSSTTKVGFAGEEHPSYLKPSCLGEPCDGNTLDWSPAQNTRGCKDTTVVGDVPDNEPHLSPSLRRPGDTYSADLRLHWPVNDGKVCDWEGAEALLRSGVMGMQTQTFPNLSPQPIFMVEKSTITSASRRRYTVRFCIFVYYSDKHNYLYVYPLTSHH